MPSHFLSQLPTLERNLRTLYRRRTDADESAGLCWYDRAHGIIRQWAETYELSIATVACVTAAISPQCDWTRNLVIADDVLAGRMPSIGGAILSNVRKAERIRDDRASNTLPYFPFGPKVATFSANLAGNYDVATVDTHATQAALNDVMTRISLKWPSYVVFSQAYVNAARKLELPPAVFQAIIWHIWKRLHPRVAKIHARQQWVVCGELEETA